MSGAFTQFVIICTNNRDREGYRNKQQRKNFSAGRQRGGETDGWRWREGEREGQIRAGESVWD